MKVGVAVTATVCSLLLWSGSSAAEVRVNLRNIATGIELSWQPEGTGLATAAEFRFEESDDLVHWRLHSRHILPKGRTEPWQAQISTDRTKGFYRILSNFDVELVRAEAADILGYGDIFKAELSRIGQISPEDLAALYPDEDNYVPGISWDPTSATFFAQYQSPPTGGGRDFQLNTIELDLFKKNGFVVTSRIAQTNFTDLYYDIFVRDLPVYVTADSMLHAWFKSYESILEYLEELYLAPSLKAVLKGMAEELANLGPVIGQGPLQQSLLDADYFLTVARVLAGESAQSRFGQDALVSETLGYIDQEQMREVPLFGRTDFLLDFSQFKVRSHYVRSQTLSNYFRAMMWCGRVDLRIAGNPKESSARELGTALVLHEAMVRSGKLPLWTNMDAAIRTLMGHKDSMDFAQMAEIMRSANLASLADIKTAGDLGRIKSAIEEGEFGIQEILSDAYISPFGPQQVWLPRSFTVFGQRFTFDAWALGKVVFDQILWRDDPAAAPEKVLRRRASGLDTAFAVLQNNAVVPEIVARINNSTGLRFRDGLPYQHNLAAARAVIDQQEESAWHGSIYGDWLWTLRAFSEPMTASHFPESMRTHAWALRRVNTQLASWAQLRHTSVLYAKQTYVPIYLCFYPAGFVEPNPAFWGALQQMAANTRAVIQQLPMEGTASWQNRADPRLVTMLDLPTIKTGQLAFLDRFASQVAMLKTLAEKELRQESFTTNENTLLLDLVEVQLFYGERRYTGWYPGLYYGANEGFDSFSANTTGPAGPGGLPLRADYVPDFRKGVPLVTDVLTASPDAIVGDPGAVMHQAVGNVHFMLVAVDNGTDRMVFGGPVFSHYEFDVPGINRLNDAEWQAKLDSGTQPPPPDWTRTWLAPK